MTTSSPKLLCRSLDVRQQQSIVLQKELLSGYHISLRPVSVYADHDITAIHEWLSDGRKAGLPVDQLRVFFILLGESTYAQAFMVLLNGDTPIGQFEVYQVLQDELKDAIDATEGDYRIYIPVMPVIELMPDVTIRILQTSLTYLFSHAEVNRVFWVIPANDKERNKIADRTGFQLLRSLTEVMVETDQPARVYEYIRTRFF
jgi:hypothetical protein